MPVFPAVQTVPRVSWPIDVVCRNVRHRQHNLHGAKVVGHGVLRALESIVRKSNGLVHFDADEDL